MFQQLFGSSPPKAVALDALKAEQVKAALRSSVTLRSLAIHDEAVAALTNLKTLSWVMTAGGAMGTNSGELTSHTAVEGHRWDFWTGRRVDVQGLMMRLARREASFERSFAISELEPAEATIFQNRPSQLLPSIRRNRIEFEHDLAADWARFQHFKEIVNDVPAWTAYAAKPLWAEKRSAPKPPRSRTCGMLGLRPPCTVLGTGNLDGNRDIGDPLGGIDLFIAATANPTAVVSLD